MRATKFPGLVPWFFIDQLGLLCRGEQVVYITGVDMKRVRARMLATVEPHCPKMSLRLMNIFTGLP